jgi:hypothetical protein
MSKENHPENQQVESSTPLMVPVFGQELLRDLILPDLLGKEEPQILYWAGKQLARKFPLTSIIEIVNFFKDAGWGHLALIRENKHYMEFELSGELIKRRYELNSNCHFQLEAGFLAQQVELQKKLTSETLEEQKRKSHTVFFKVQWDLKDSTN